MVRGQMRGLNKAPTGGVTRRHLVRDRGVLKPHSGVTPPFIGCQLGNSTSTSSVPTVVDSWLAWGYVSPNSEVRKFGSVNTEQYTDTTRDPGMNDTTCDIPSAIERSHFPSAYVHPFSVAQIRLRRTPGER